MEPVRLREVLSTFSEAWQPRVVASFNGHDVLVARFQGEFVWHHHDDTDDLFLVLAGRVTIRLRDREVTLGPGDLFVVPVGVEHCPVSPEGAEVLLLERAGTPNTGDPASAAPRRVVNPPGCDAPRTPRAGAGPSPARGPHSGC